MKMIQSVNNSANLVLYTAGLLLINNRRLLLAYSRNKQCFYLPGGAGAEIEELRYFNLGDYRKENHQPPGVLSILEKLKADNLVD